MKNEIEVTGKTVDDAIKKGLKKLKIEKKDAEIKILDEGKSGLFGLMGSTPARIKISVKGGTTASAISDEKMDEISCRQSYQKNTGTCGFCSQNVHRDIASRHRLKYLI